MCGIAGFFHDDPIAPAAVAASLAELRRRGPDSQHVVSWDGGWQRLPGDPSAGDRSARDRSAGDRSGDRSGDRLAGDGSAGAARAGLLHARLAIIDPRPEGDQPMANERGDVWICYNGEVYDWAGHARELQARGVVMRTRTDTEFILRAYETWGIDCLQRLRGMFAFVIVDLRSRKLWAVRDRMGEKPLVYSHGAHGFAFGSTVRAVLPLVPAEARRLSADALDAYLAHRYLPAPMTVAADVQRLENGHLLCYDLERRTLEKRRWWQPAPAAGDWLAELDAAVRMRTVADRPLGVFLSGGIDSGVVASRLAAQGHNRLASFTAAFPGTEFDESGQAAAVAAALGFPNHRVELPADAAADFDRVVGDFDEPFADPSMFPTWQLARATTREVKVVLSGDGGDELFAGYKRYEKHLRTAWRRGLRLPGLPLSASLQARGVARWSAELRMDWTEAYSLRFSGFTPAQRRALQPGRAAAPATWWRPVDGEPQSDPLARLLQIDLANYLPEYILRKGDLATMAHGLELRAPLLDHRWYETLIALPAAERFTQPRKTLLRAAMTLPPALDPFAAKKRGFNPPVAAMLRSGLAGRLPGLGARLGEVTGGRLSAAAVDALIERFGGGSPALAEQVLQLLILETSLRQLRELGVSA